MKKILFVANIPEHLEGFHYPYMSWFQSIGWEVHAVTAEGKKLEHCDSQKFISVERTPFHLSNFKAYLQIKKIIETEKYDLIHCNTATPSILAIIAAKKSRKNYNTKVINTIHGFWFFKGSPIKNWFFYPIYKYCAKYTDCLVTINQEDYVLAQKKMKAKRIFKVNGVGFKDKFLKEMPSKDREIQAYKENLCIDSNTTVLISVGELNNNKNHRLVIETLSKLNEKEFVYLIAGEGPLYDDLEELIRERNLNGKVLLLGVRNDIYNLLRVADVFIFPSKREGLSVSLMEAMASALPCIVSNIRGNNDLIDENGGILFESNNHESLKDALLEIMNDPDKREMMGKYNRIKSENYSIENVFPEMKKIYRNFIDE